MASSRSSLLPKADHFISLEQAKQMTATYRAEKENILPFSETFERTAFDALLAEDGCEGIRIYFGMNADLMIKVIVVGVNDKNMDILPQEQGSTMAAGDGKIVEEGQRCPDYCPPPPHL